jgi:hypothetical protein
MSQQIGGYPPAPATGAPTMGQPTTQVARDEAGEVGRTAADAGRQVAGTAAEQAANVAQEVKSQARDLVGEARDQVQQQAQAGQQKATDGIRGLAQELRQMADSGQQSGTAYEVARQAADRAEGLADWIGRREPGDLVEEVRSLARRRPAAFLLGAALAGVVVGRLTRGAVDSARSDSDDASGQALYGRPRPAPVPYDRLATPGPAIPVDTPTPPRGYAAAPLPPAYPEPVRDPDPLDPAGRHGSGTVGDYVDEIERNSGRRLRTGPDDVLDEPYRPGHEELR